VQDCKPCYSGSNPGEVSKTNVMSTSEIIKTLIKIVLDDHPEFLEEGTTGNDLIRAAEIVADYPHQDGTWPSRRWNHDFSDYIDLSGHSDGEPLPEITTQS
jgi:hypothetical protein